MSYAALQEFFSKLLNDLYNTDTEFALFVSLIVIATIVLDAVALFTRKQKQLVGIASKEQPQQKSQVQSVLAKRYISEIQGLSGSPDAVIIENGFFIPVERKPLARKIRDRYVAQLLVYMRLIEEFEGKRPPYGYLILGKNCRRVKIDNTEQRQQWLQQILDEMRAILANQHASVASPQEKKCKQCAVRQHCTKAIGAPIQIGRYRDYGSHNNLKVG